MLPTVWRLATPRANLKSPWFAHLLYYECPRAYAFFVTEGVPDGPLYLDPLEAGLDMAAAGETWAALLERIQDPSDRRAAAARVLSYLGEAERLRRRVRQASLAEYGVEASPLLFVLSSRLDPAELSRLPALLGLGPASLDFTLRFIRAQSFLLQDWCGAMGVREPVRHRHITIPAEPGAPLVWKVYEFSPYESGTYGFLSTGADALLVSLAYHLGGSRGRFFRLGEDGLAAEVHPGVGPELWPRSDPPPVRGTERPLRGMREGEAGCAVCPYRRRCWRDHRLVWEAAPAARTEAGGRRR